MDYKDLNAWKLSFKMVKDIYKLTLGLPKEENYGLKDQMRRSAVSILSNIAEGSARNSDKEFIHFLYIALGSSAELETQILLSIELSYFLKSNDLNVLNQLVEIRKCIIGLINHLKRKQLK